MGAVDNQRSIGFHTSAPSVDLLNIYPHQAGHLDASADIELLSRRLLDEAVPYAFATKDRIFDLLIQIENARTCLCYGRPQDKAVVEATLGALTEVRDHRALYGYVSRGRGYPGQLEKAGALAVSKGAGLVPLSNLSAFQALFRKLKIPLKVRVLYEPEATPGRLGPKV